MSLQIDIIPSHNINKTKWDRCIDESGYGLIYAKSFYLDSMADNWDGIVVNDYECVMPIPWRKKIGIRYCYDVPFIQQLGYYSANEKVDGKKLLEAMTNFTPYGHYNFNYHNREISGSKDVTKRTNLIIELSDNESILKRFKNGFHQSLHRASAHQLSFEKGTSTEAIEMYTDIYNKHLGNISNNDYSNLETLSALFLSKGNSITRKVVDNSGKILSIVMLFRDGRRLYNIINATENEGREKESNYFLYAQLFSEFSGQGLLFDLEGSDIAGVKSFYNKMGATEQPYFRMHINKLPFPLKLLGKNK